MDRNIELESIINEDDFWIIKCVGKIEMLDLMIKELENERDILKEKITK